MDSDLACTPAQWRGTVQSNTHQILRGDLYVLENTHCESGMSVKVVSTSQLEGFHAALKKLVARKVSVEVGSRILDLFILKVSLNVMQNWAGIFV